MILDLKRFVAAEGPYWSELEQLLDGLDRRSDAPPTLDQVRRLHYLYERACAGLVRLGGISSERAVRQNLEQLVARAYAQINLGQRRPPLKRAALWLWRDFPAAVRRRRVAGLVITAAMFLGALLGGFAAGTDREFGLQTIVPAQFSHLLGDPSERVREEESEDPNLTSGDKANFSAALMANNIRVSLLAFALGATFGIGTLIVEFYNGVILGLVVVDYIQAGEGVFLVAWLLPHGSIEIPAILIAGQAGLCLGATLLFPRERLSLGERLAEVRDDLLALLGGCAVLLVWAGLVEAFFSQYHAPILPYWLKIAFGTAQLGAFVFFLCYAGRSRPQSRRR
ncbi:MAG: stage II sporulation protein M [Opitutales bacterium]